MNDSVLTWDGNWAWSLPLIVLSVMLHVAGLDLINRAVLKLIASMRGQRNVNLLLGLVSGLATLLATLLHAVEAGIWAILYRALGAMQSGRSAMLYSLNAITTYGHSDLYLEAHWRLMGALEALNGMLLFGLTTAFLYGVLQRVWPTQWQAGLHRDEIAAAGVKQTAPGRDAVGPASLSPSHRPPAAA
jgi:MFS superfamily sulfate permease-like transporter